MQCAPGGLLRGACLLPDVQALYTSSLKLDREQRDSVEVTHEKDTEASKPKLHHDAHSERTCTVQVVRVALAGR
ncbi:hypothetical protein IWZ03DRAFT_367666 [Phyllosticta citriasiana]|uniref:Secreted protein n=1 Tax=Phyllosticta citriasiana TaxID=595635 RepID=A0ABR1L0X2_9PEZI